MPVLEVSEELIEKLSIVQKELDAASVEKALDQSLNMAHFVAETINNPETKLLVQRKGKYQELKGFA